MFWAKGSKGRWNSELFWGADFLHTNLAPKDNLSLESPRYLSERRGFESKLLVDKDR